MCSLRRGYILKHRAVYARLRTLVFAALPVGGSSLHAKESPLAWQRWEHTLISKNQDSHPYDEVTVHVKFTGPRGQSFSTWAYWEGRNTYKIRAAFPTRGKWVRWFDPIANRYIESGHRQKDEGNEFVSPGLSESLLLIQK